MLPHELQATMAKILFIIFATCLLCITKVRANDLKTPKNLVKNKIYCKNTLQ